jgi:hypothetical protein
MSRQVEAGRGKQRRIGLSVSAYRVQDQPLDRLDHPLAEENSVVDRGRRQGLAVLLEVVDLGLARLAEGVELLLRALAPSAPRAEAKASPASEHGAPLRVSARQNEHRIIMDGALFALGDVVQQRDFLRRVHAPF